MPRLHPRCADALASRRSHPGSPRKACESPFSCLDWCVGAGLWLGRLPLHGRMGPAYRIVPAPGCSLEIGHSRVTVYMPPPASPRLAGARCSGRRNPRQPADVAPTAHDQSGTMPRATGSEQRFADVRSACVLATAQGGRALRERKASWSSSGGRRSAANTALGRTMPARARDGFEHETLRQGVAMSALPDGRSGFAAGSARARSGCSASLSSPTRRTTRQRKT